MPRSLSGLFSAARHSADPLSGVLQGNQASRETLERLGAEDPTKPKGPSLLSRVFGVLDTPGTAIRGLAHNIFAPGERDVDVWDEVVKSLKGEDRVEGADILSELGVENKWGKMLGGFAIDVLLDPLTYITLGYTGAAKAGGRSLVNAVLKYGDDVAKWSDDVVKGFGGAKKASSMVGELIGKYGDDLLNLADPKASRAVMSTASDIMSRSLGKQSGVKFMGQSLGGQGGLDKAAFGTKDLLRKLPGSEWFERSFVHGRQGSLTPMFRGGNEVLNTFVKQGGRTRAGKSNFARQMTEEFADDIRKAVPDERNRLILGLAYSKQAGDIDTLTEFSRRIDAVRKAAKGGLDEDQVAKLYRTALVFRDEQILGKANLSATLKELGIPDPEIANLVKVAGGVQDAFSASYDRMVASGLDVNQLFSEGAESFAYLPNMEAVARGKKSQGVFEDFLRSDVGVDPSDLRTRGGSPYGGMAGSVEGSRIYPTQEMRARGVSIDDLLSEAPTRKIADRTSGLSTEFDIAELSQAGLTKQSLATIEADFVGEMTKVIGDNPNLIAQLKKVSTVLTDDEAVKGFLGFYDRFLNVWKKMATTWNIPFFHARNKGSNQFLLWTEGIFDPVEAARAHSIFGRWKAGKKLLSNEEDLIRMARERRVIVGTFEQSEEIGRGTAKFPLTKAGEWVGENLVEDVDRFSGFITALKKGSDPDAAAVLVDKALYNYGPEALSTFERHFMRRLVPFYRWAKSNTPHMVELMAKQPGKATWLGHLRESGEAAVPIDKSVMPDWMEQLGVIPTPLTSKEGSPLMLNPNMPLQDLGKLDLQMRDLFGQMSPLIKLPFELLVAKKDVYFDDDLTGEFRRAPGYIEKFSDLIDATPLRDSWRMLLDAVGVVEVEQDGDSYLKMHEGAVKFFRDISPWLNNMGKLLQDRERQPFDQIAYGTGVKMMPFNEAELTGQKAYSDRDELQQMLAVLRSKGEDTSKPEQASLADLFGSR